jgi:hypothetical protein
MKDNCTVRSNLESKYLSPPIATCFFVLHELV